MKTRSFLTALTFCAAGFTALLIAGGCNSGGPGGEVKPDLKGSGSTFIKPVMDKWVAEYTKLKGGQINYQPTGSGAGVKQMVDEAVDFGCTDAYMKDEDLKKAEEKHGKIVHLPLTMGAIVPAYNLEGVDKPLNFTRDVLAGIFLGYIKKWNDPKIQEINTGVALPDKEISVVTRADSSGSTSIFTEFLSKAPAWEKAGLGHGTTVKWKAGTAESQTAGVAGRISKNPGTIGYVELFYAVQNKIQYGAVQNQDKEFVLGSLESVSKAAENKLKDIPDDLRYSLVDVPGKGSYPISGTTWAVVYAKQSGDRGKMLVDFFSWILKDGQQLGAAMQYAPLPPPLVTKVEEKLQAIGK